MNICQHVVHTRCCLVFLQMGCGQSQSQPEIATITSHESLEGLNVPILLPSDFSDLQYVCAGGSGTVFSAWSSSLNKRVALKMFGYEECCPYFQAIHHEITCMKVCAGKRGFAELYGVFQDSYSGLAPSKIFKQNFPVIVMTYLEGGDLLGKVGLSSSNTEENVKEMFRQILLALDTLHRMHYIHRDIKLENVMFETSASDSPVRKSCLHCIVSPPIVSHLLSDRANRLRLNDGYKRGRKCCCRRSMWYKGLPCSRDSQQRRVLSKVGYLDGWVFTLLPA